jgi:pimeloyl-ACP methyl ester carboxylesterase
MNIYCISGLGADKRAFKLLSLNQELIHIDWLKSTKNESLSSYCIRLAEQINSKEPFILIGLSFGGLVACEIAKFLKPEKVILLSSITNKKHLPLMFRVIGSIGLHKIIPPSWMKPPMSLAYWLFGIKKKENKLLLKEIFEDTDLDFLKWAVRRLLSNEEIIAPSNLIRIHGTNDKMLPLKDKDRVVEIEGGGHFMVIEQASDVSEALKRISIKEIPL